MLGVAWQPEARAGGERGLGSGSLEGRRHQAALQRHLKD